jgi:hypothetical protein
MWPFGWRVHPTIEIGVCADHPVTRARIFVDLSLTSVGPARITIGTAIFQKDMHKDTPSTNFDIDMGTISNFTRKSGLYLENSWGIFLKVGSDSVLLK